MIVVCVTWCLFVISASAMRGSAGARACWRGAARAGPGATELGSGVSFPWLGVLRVHLHEESGMKLALTGIALVKDNYAVGNADDITRIPKRIFREDSRAMFTPESRRPRLCRLEDYLTPPQHAAGAHSLALLELSADDTTHFPAAAACWPPAGYSLSSHLYAVGYTDENEVLEKFIYKLEYVEPQLCHEFYNRAGLRSGGPEPAELCCGRAVDNSRHCEFDNGIALATNSSGHWMLLGLGLHGPGCSAPARFLSLREYYPWIEAVTQGAAEQAYRKSAFNTGFRAPAELRDVATHALLGSRRHHVKHEFAHYYPYESFLRDPFRVTRVNATRLDILPARGQYSVRHGSCSTPGLELVYRDLARVAVLSGGRRGRATYLLTLMDTGMQNYTCISLRLHSLSAHQAYLRYSWALTDDSLFPETPPELLLTQPPYQLQQVADPAGAAHLLPAPVRGGGRNISAYNLHLSFEVSFLGACRLELVVYGARGSPPAPRRPPATTSTSTSTAQPTTDPYKSPGETRLLRQLVQPAGERSAGGRLHASLLPGHVIYLILYIFSRTNK